jgi:hypothetical protein
VIYCFPKISTYAKKASAAIVINVPAATVVESKNVLYFSFLGDSDDIIQIFFSNVINIFNKIKLALQ